MTDMTIGAAVERCMEEARLARAKATARTYRNGLELFEQFLAQDGLALSAPLQQLATTHFIRFPAWLITREFQRSTLRVYLAGVKYFFDWLVLAGRLQPDYQEMLQYQRAAEHIFKKRESRLPRLPGKDDAARMRETARQMGYDSPAKERNIALVEFLYSTGCRNQETAQLRLQDIDLQERRALVTGKGSKERVVFFSSDAAQAIRDYLQARGSLGADGRLINAAEPLFCRHDRGAGTRKRKPLSTRSIDTIIVEIAGAAGIQRGKFTPHYFRHAFAIRMLRETGNLALVQDLLGHASSDSTRVYAKIYPEELRDAHRAVFP